MAHGPGTPSRSRPRATVSLVLGILGVLSTMVSLVYWILALTGVIDTSYYVST